MPTYCYECRGCGHRFEARQSMADEALSVCPECSGALRRIIQAAGISFKGSGFYSTSHIAAPRDATRRPTAPSRA